MATPHGNVSFLCTSLTGTITGVQWLVNNMTLEDIDNTDITSEFSNQFRGIGSLGFTNIPLAYNGTIITCRVHGEEEDTALILIQGSCIAILLYRILAPTYNFSGHLSAVGSLNITASGSTLSLTWEPPFSLDITNVDPDITGYCVDVINSTSSVTLHSVCGINTTMFTYPLPDGSIHCTVVLFNIVPHNIVGPGKSATKSYIGALSSRLSHLLFENNNASNLGIRGPQIMAVLNMLPDVEIRDWDVFTYFLNMVIKSIKYAYFALITI